MSIRTGLKVLEFEKGKTGILVGPVEDLGEVLDILIAATMAGELDLLLASATDIEERAVPKTKKRSKSRSNF